MKAELFVTLLVLTARLRSRAKMPPPSPALEPCTVLDEITQSVMVAIASIFFLIPADAPISWLALVLYGVLQVARYWVIGTLGPYWTHRIITLPDAPVVRRGPYAWVQHPNYMVTIAETLLLPIVFGAAALGAIMTAIWSAVLYYKIVLEDAALAKRRCA